MQEGSVHHDTDTATSRWYTPSPATLLGTMSSQPTAKQKLNTFRDVDTVKMWLGRRSKCFGTTQSRHFFLNFTAKKKETKQKLATLKSDCNNLWLQPTAEPLRLLVSGRARGLSHFKAESLRHQAGCTPRSVMCEPNTCTAMLFQVPHTRACVLASALNFSAARTEEEKKIWSPSPVTEW